MANKSEIVVKIKTPIGVATMTYSVQWYGGRVEMDCPRPEGKEPWTFRARVEFPSDLYKPDATVRLSGAEVKDKYGFKGAGRAGKVALIDCREAIVAAIAKRPELLTSLIQKRLDAEISKALRELRDAKARAARWRKRPNALKVTAPNW